MLCLYKDLLSIVLSVELCEIIVILYLGRGNREKLCRRDYVV